MRVSMADPLPTLNSLLPVGIKVVAYVPGKRGEAAKFFEVKRDTSLPTQPETGGSVGTTHTTPETSEGIDFVLLYENRLI